MAESTKKYDFGFKVQSKGLFTVTDPENMKPYEIKNIGISKLQPFKNHPFKLYEGDRFNDMCKSISESGILLPIIVRPIEDETYEILSGHNRVEAAKVAGLEFVPGIIRENLSDGEALLIVTETNLIQRGFESLSHSEKAVVIKTHMDAIKSQGRRSDLINEIDLLLNTGKTDNISSCDLLGHKSKSRDKAADKYGLSPTNISRYVRLCELNKPLLNRVDKEEIGLYAAVSISYLSAEEQIALNQILDETEYRINMKTAETLRSYSESQKLTKDNMILILSGELSKKTKTKSSASSFKIKHKIYAKYFDDTVEHEEAETIIDKALEEYFALHLKKGMQ